MILSTAKNVLRKAGIKKPTFACIITPVFDGGIVSLDLLVQELMAQSFGRFIHVSISNGESLKIKKYLENIRKVDKRFIYDELPYEKDRPLEKLMANLGKRREYCLKKYNAAWYAFMDADLKITDHDYLSKLYRAYKKFKTDVIITQTYINNEVYPKFPLKLNNIDMANYTFSKKIAKKYSYPNNYSPKYKMANDYRFFEKISTPDNTVILNFISAVTSGNKFYKSVTDIRNEEKK